MKQKTLKVFLMLLSLGGCFSTAWAADAPTITIDGTTVTINNETASSYDSTKTLTVSDSWQTKGFWLPTGTGLSSGTMVKVKSIAFAVPSTGNFVDKIGLVGCVSASAVRTTGGFTTANADKVLFSFEDSQCYLRAGYSSQIWFLDSTGAKVSTSTVLNFTIGAASYQHIDSLVWSGAAPVVEVVGEIMTGSYITGAQTAIGNSGTDPVYASEVTGWLDTENNKTGPMVLVGSNAGTFSIGVNNGNSVADASGKHSTWGKLSGSGSLGAVNAQSTGTYPILEVHDASEFTGSIVLANGGPNLSVVFCTAEESDDLKGSYYSWFRSPGAYVNSLYVSAASEVTIPAGKTWQANKLVVEGEATINGTLTGAVVNNGNLTINGTVTGAISNTGKLVVEAGATISGFGSNRDFDGVYVDSSIPVKITMTAEEYGKGSVSVTGADGISTITVLAPDGTTEVGTITPEEGAGTLETGVKVSGKACWIDYEMAYDNEKTGFENTGVSSLDLQKDSSIEGSNAFTDDGMLYTYAHPYRQGLTIPSTWTAVVRCTVPNYPDAAVIIFGWNNNYIGLVAGETPKTEMRLVQYKTGYDHYVTNAVMNVQDATTAQHVYVFAVENSQTLKVYCDGSVILDKELDEPLTITSGFQVGSVLGGAAGGIVRFAKNESPANTLAESVQKDARIDCVRLYDYSLSADQLAALSAEFPAVKLYEATVAVNDDTTWADLDWSNDWDGGNEYSKVLLTVEGDAAVVLPDSITAEELAFEVEPGSTLTLKGPGSLAVTRAIDAVGFTLKLTGTVTFATDTTFAGNVVFGADFTKTGDGAIQLANGATVGVDAELVVTALGTYTCAEGTVVDSAYTGDGVKLIPYTSAVVSITQGGTTLYYSNLDTGVGTLNDIDDVSDDVRVELLNGTTWPTTPYDYAGNLRTKGYYIDGNGVLTKAVARITSTPYSTFEAAVEAADDGATVTLLLASSEAITLNKAITLNENGKEFSGTLTGTGTLTFAAFRNNPSITFTDWTGTVMLPEFAADGINFGSYGKAGSTIALAGITSGWIDPDASTVAATLKLDGPVCFTAMSTRTYTFAEITGTGDLAFSTTDGEPTVTITKVAEGYDGTISSTLDNAVNISILDRKAGTSTASGTKLLSTSSNVAAFALTIAGEATGIMPVFKDDGLYAFIASVTKGGETEYYNSAEAAVAALGSDEGTIALYRTTELQITLGDRQTLQNGNLALGGVVCAATGIELVQEGNTYTAIDNRNSIWSPGSGSDNAWSTAANWSTGRVPQEYTAITFPEGASTVIVTDYNSEAHKCASMTVDGTVTITYTEGEDYYPEVTLYGDVSGMGKLILKRAGLRNLSAGEVAIACAFGVQYNHTTNDSFLRGNNFNITGNMTVDGYLKIEEGTTAIATGVATLGNGANIRALNTATLTIAELVAPDGVTATMGTSGSGTLTVAKMTGAGDVTFTNCTITQLDDYTGTLGGTLSIGTVNVTAIDPEARLVKMSAGCTISNLAETTVTKGGNPTEYRLYAKEDGLYVKTALAVFRSAATGGWLDANSWTNVNGETVGWTTDYLMYANIDAGQIESIDIGGSDSVEMAKLTITGAETSSVTLTIDGTIAIDQELDLGGMAGTIVKDGAGKFTAKGDNSGATLYWTVEDGTLSLGGEFDSIGGNGTVVNLDGGVLDIAGAHGGQHSKTLVVNGAGSVFTNSVGVADSYGHSFPFAHIQVKADSSFGGDEEWGAIASAYGASNIDIAEGCTFTKIGAGKFCINNMAISGAGTLKVAAGVLDKGGTCTVDNLEIENWSNIAGDGSITVNKRLIINNGADATVKLSERSMAIADNATVELKNAGTLDVGTWRANNYVLKVPTTGGKIQVTLSGLDEMELELAVAGLDESDIGNVILKDSGGNDVSGTYTLKRSGNTIRIVRSVKCMVANPVTGEHVAVKYAFTGATDSTWEKAGNWNEAYSDYSDWSALSDTTVPALPGSNKWSPLLFDGDLVQNGNTDVTLTDPLEGWELKLAAVNGAHVNVATLNKLQGNSPMWIMVDDTSTLTFGAWGSGNSSNSLTYYVANEDGVTWNMAFNKDISLEYYLAGAGSVNYAAGVTAGTHGIKRAELTLGTGDYKTIVRRALVKFSSSSVTFDTSELEVLSDEAETPAVLVDSALMGTEAVGTYQVLKEATGIYLEYIGRTETAPKEYVISGSGTKTWTWDDTAPGANDTVTVKLTGEMTLDLGEEAITIGRLVVLNEGTEDVATLTLSGATLNAGSIIVGEAVEVASSVAAQLAGTLQGSGTVTYTGVMPTGLVMNDNGWKGVLWLKSVALAGPKPGTLAGDHSTLRLTGCTGYFNDNGTAGQNPQISYGTLDLRDDGETIAFTVDNGWSSDGVTVFGKLTGDGTLGCSTRNIAQRYVFIDPSEFIGTINCARTDDTSKLNLRVILGDGANLSPDSGTITIVAGATATMLKTWTASSIINNGTLHLAIDPPDALANNGALVLLSDNLNLNGMRDLSAVSLADGVAINTIQVNQTQSEYLNGVTTLTNVPAKITSVQINKFSGDATMAVKDPESNTWKLDEGAHPEGKAALYDFTFNAEKYQDNIAEDATFPNFGSSSSQLSADTSWTTATSLDKEAPNNLYARTSPYITAGNYPSTFTAVVYGTMPAEENNTLIAFGYRTGGFLALVRGETVNDVNLVWCNSDANNKEVISPMRAKAATATKHLYVFTKSEEYISVYLDGQLQIRKKYNSKWTLGSNGGFQVGSVLGGEVSGVATRPEADDPAVIEMVRIFGEELSDAVMAKLVKDYPFIDITTESTRTIASAEGTNTWYSTEVGTWANTPEDDGHLPATNADVILTVAGEVPQWMSVVLNGDTVDAPNAIGDLHITGSQALTIRKSIGGHPVSISGVLTNDVDLTIHYGALDMATIPLQMGATGRITFDLTELVDGKRDTEPVYLTGTCEYFGARVTYVNNSSNNLISLAGFSWDGISKRYRATFTASRGNKEVYFEPVEGGADNLFNKDSAVYYLQDETHVPTYIIAGDTLCFLVDEAATVTIATNDEMVAVAGYKIPAGVTVVFNEDLTVPVEGAGTIVMNKCKPQVTIDAVKNSLQDSAKWTGTLAIERVEFGNTSLSKLGNANSTIRLAGCSIYPQVGYEVASTLEIDNATYGYGLHLRGVSAVDGQEVVFDRLTGSGLLMNVGDAEATTHNYLRILDASGFSGPVTNDAVGVTMLFGTGAAAEGSVVITADTSFSDALNLRSSMCAATNLIVRSNLIVGEKDVRITADSVDFGTSGTIAITGEDLYPTFIVQNKITGTIYVSLADSLAAADDITVLRVNKAEYLPPNVQPAPGAAQGYTLVIDADGKGYSLVNEGFYIRIR